MLLEFCYSTDQGGSGLVTGHRLSASQSSPIVLTSGDAIVHSCIDGRIGAHLQDLVASGTWSPKKNCHINLLEMHVILLVSHIFQDRQIGHTVRLMIDNTSVVVYINKQWGTIFSSLYLLAGHFLTWAELYGQNPESFSARWEILRILSTFPLRFHWYPSRLVGTVPSHSYSALSEGDETLQARVQMPIHFFRLE